MSETASELRELYQEIVLEHSRHPRNFKKLAQATCSTEGFNPLCGDHIHLHLQVENGRIVDIGLEGSGCAISKASASVMSTLIKGQSVAEALALFDSFHQLVTVDGPVENIDRLGDMVAFAGVRAYPVRVKCATLAWHALSAALKSEAKQVSTE